MPLEFRMGGEIYSDSLGGPNSGAATYASMMRHNLRVIVGALKNE
jgi:ABC-type Zn uptake system ZnuABC Zn-binding protein ZnuA